MVACFLLIAAATDDLQNSLLPSLAALTYTMNWARAFSYPIDPQLGHTWSLSIEEQFYLLWPLLLASAYRWGGRNTALACATGLAVLSLSWRLYLLHAGAGVDRIYNGFDTHADALLIGCALALLRQSPATRFWFVPVAILMVVFFFAPWIAWLSLPSTIVALAGAWLISICWSGSNSRFIDLLEFSPIRYVGRISYGIYLWHWPILMELWRLGYPNYGIETAAMALILTLCCAVTSFHLVERPILRFKNRLNSYDRTAPTVERHRELLSA